MSRNIRMQVFKSNNSNNMRMDSVIEDDLEYTRECKKQKLKFQKFNFLGARWNKTLKLINNINSNIKLFVCFFSDIEEKRLL